MKRTFPPVPTADLVRFVSIVRRLRRECPWDRKQTHRSIRTHLIEEAYETVDALDRNDLDGLRHELGDLLLHVVMHATMAEEAGEFTFRDVVRDVSAKLVRRHPHVFGAARVRTVEDVKRNWERLKLDEGRTSVLEGIPRHLPALQRALRVQQRASKVGFDWTSRQQVWEKVREELEEFRNTLASATPRRRREEFGDVLFALVNYARFVRVHPEEALRGTIDTFTRRFRHIERRLRASGKDIHEVGLDELDRLWNEAKRTRSAKRARSTQRTRSAKRKR
jgi:MazG family protein